MYCFPTPKNNNNVLVGDSKKHFYSKYRMHHYFYVIYDVITDVYPSARPNENEKTSFLYIFFLVVGSNIFGRWNYWFPPPIFRRMWKVFLARIIIQNLVTVLQLLHPTICQMGSTAAPIVERRIRQYILFFTRKVKCM
jgi:hypothetical protein